MSNDTPSTTFIGIDVHKRTYAVAVLQDGLLVKKCQMEASPQKFLQFCQKHYSDTEIQVAYEAGFCGFPLYRCLTAAGITCLVVNPSSIEVNSRDRVKTDKKDARKLAEHLSMGRFTCIYVPSIEQERRRGLSRVRAALVLHCGDLTRQMKSFLDVRGVRAANDSRPISIRWIEEFTSLLKDLSFEDHAVFTSLVQVWRAAGEQIRILEKLLKKQAMEDSRLEQILLSVPGIGPVASRVLANELGDMSQFRTEKALFSFTGLTPTEHSSGEHQRLGHITRQGRPVIRQILTECSWRAISKDPSLAAFHNRLKAGGLGSKRAIIAVARKLIGRIRACLRKNTPYCILEKNLED